MVARLWILSFWSVVVLYSCLIEPFSCAFVPPLSSSKDRTSVVVVVPTTTCTTCQQRRRKPILLAAADMTIQRGCQFYSIYYDLVEARTAPSKTTTLPVVVLHGGPGVPSNYLRPMEHLIDASRPILFWDQLGCGMSDRPENEAVYSMDLFVDDLVQLLQETFEGDFHLYGQSFGGLLAFEYLKRERPTRCRSVVLSSTPTNVQQVEQEANRLLQNLKVDDSSSNLQEAFRKAHQIQTETMPKPLEEAYKAAGTTFRGTAAIADYVASLQNSEDSLDERVATPALVLRGEHDFVTTKCIEGWKDLFDDVTIQELQGCAHHGMLEKPEVYGREVLESFWKKFES